MSVVFLLRDILQALESPDRPLPVLSPQPPYEQLTAAFNQKLPLGERMFFSLVYPELDHSFAQIKQLQQTAMRSID
jgi:hypothetical protein